VVQNDEEDGYGPEALNVGAEFSVLGCCPGFVTVVLESRRCGACKDSFVCQEYHPTSLVPEATLAVEPWDALTNTRVLQPHPGARLPSGIRTAEAHLVRASP
jgi:hypothetical protein